MTELTLERIAELESLNSRLPEMTWRGCGDHPKHNSNSSCWGIYSGEKKLPLVDVGEQLLAVREALPTLLAFARRALELDARAEADAGEVTEDLLLELEAASREWRVPELMAKREAAAYERGKRDGAEPFVALMLWERDDYRSVVVEHKGNQDGAAFTLSYADEGDDGGSADGDTPHEAATNLCRQLGLMKGEK